MLFPERLWEMVLLLWTWVLAGLLVTAPPPRGAPSMSCFMVVMGAEPLCRVHTGAGCGEDGEDTGVASLVPCGDNSEIAACV